MLLAAVLAAAIETRTVVLPVEQQRSIRVECALGTMTRLVFPEQLLTLRWSRGARETLGARLRSTTPLGIVEVQPTQLSTSGSLEARGLSRTLNVELTVVARGAPLEVRLVMGRAGEADAAGGAVPTRTVAVVDERLGGSIPGPTIRVAGIDAAERAAGPVAATFGVAEGPQTESGSPAPQVLAVAQSGRPGPVLPTVDLAGMLDAKVVAIGRREGQPGRREVILLDALKSQNWVWLRFSVRGGAREHVGGVWWGTHQLGSYLAEASGEDLRVIVQVPDALAKPKNRVTLQVGGGEYRFALRSGTLGGLFGTVFR